ncbi:MAG: DUF2156 domain-containing protein [Desulfobacterales bacterium]|nr:MAG: DUF2156 domain-containing protein [Desulfobacterales bacterium]
MNLNFEPIRLDKQNEYNKLLDSCPQVASDYSFLNLWAWAEDYGLSWAWDEKIVWIKQTRPEAYWWAPIGAWDLIDWQSRFAGRINTPMIFIRVPEKLVECWRAALGNRIETAEAREHWDYVYAVQDLIELRGNRYHKKKNLFNQFIKNYEYTYVPFGPDLIKQAMDMQEDWCTWRDCESSEVLSAENKAISKILTDWQNLDGTMGGAIIVDGRMAAYTVADRLTQDTVVIHFEKGDTQYKGVYQAINQMFLAHEAADFALVNREQDLNDEGLRKAKLSYHPVEFLRKYRVALTGSF